MKRLTLLIAVMIITAILYAPPAIAGKLNVFVSILPQKYFVEQIGGDRINVSVMVPPGAEPATYEPAPTQMTALSKTSIYFAIGVPFERAWLPRFAGINPKMRIIHTESGIAEKPIDRNMKNDANFHGIPDPHVWLSPPLVMLQARNILAALIAADPAHFDTYTANYKKFIAAIADLDTKLQRQFPAGEKRTEFMVFHPAWGYFADAYGLKQIPIEVEGKSPKAAELQKLISKARKKHIRIVLVEPQFSARDAGVIARSIDGKIVYADPLAYDWAKNLLKVAATIKSALR